MIPTFCLPVFPYKGQALRLSSPSESHVLQQTLRRILRMLEAAASFISITVNRAMTQMKLVAGSVFGPELRQLVSPGTAVPEGILDAGDGYSAAWVALHNRTQIR